MEDLNDTNLKREGPGLYGHAQPNNVQRMPPAETSGLHNYPPPPPAPGIHGSAVIPPSPYEVEEHRSHPPEGPLHQQPPYPHHTYPPPPQSREQGVYGPPDSGYRRQGSISTPARSPADAPHPPYYGVNGNAHEGPYYPPHHQPDYRPRTSYGPPESPANGNQPHHALHLVTGHEMMSGQPPGPQYGPPSAGGPQTPIYPGAYYQDQHYNNNNNQRRKPIRAAQACDSCRQRKAKCDEGRPVCQHCSDNHLKCTYREVPPQKQEKQVLAINDKLESMDDRIHRLLNGQDENTERMNEKIERMNDKINRMLSMAESQARQMDAMQNMLPHEQRPGLHGSRKDLQTTPVSRSFKRETPQPNGAPSSAGANQSFGGVPDLDPLRAGESQYANPMTADFALPPKHTTAAQNLLRWPSIKELIPKNHNESYVMDIESTRGLLRLYGCGEGEDKNDGGEGAASPANSSSSGGRHDDDMSTPSPGGVWGSGQLPPPSPNQMAVLRDHPGGISPQGGLILDADVVDRYFRSYMDHMHILHPFLEAKVLRDMVTLFKRRYSWDYRLQQRIPAATGKRKREAEDSPNLLNDAHSNHVLPKHHNRHPGVPVEIEHSITNAIVLLVIALGKICAHREPLPAAPSPCPMPTSTPHHNAYADLPMSVSAPTSPYYQATPKSGIATLNVYNHSNPQGKNADVIPGLGYFAKVADILGELPGGTDVSYVQANLLAGLYMGQLARIFQSHHYISNACKACMVLIDSTAYRMKSMRPAKRNLINFAFWSCLQLESDILAEVELPPSGITRYEGFMHQEIPTGITLDAIPEMANTTSVLRFYSYQIQLRRTLNDIHTGLYRDKPLEKKPPTFALIEALNVNLEQWRDHLVDWHWDDDDHMSADVNVARMRAKYYGAKYITYRPALYYALSLSAGQTRQRPSESPLANSFTSQHHSPAHQHLPAGSFARVGSDMGPPVRGLHPPLDEKVKEAVKACIAAAVRSTTAFDKVPPRLIITNIFGTAHAQFGNMVVLAAAFNSTNPELSSLVDERKFRELLDRTIGFLKLSESISGVLKYDAEILQTIKTNLFSEPTSATTSFTSR